MVKMQKQLRIEPATPGLIMAIGIFLYSVLQVFPRTEKIFAAPFAIALLFIWLATFYFLIWQYSEKQGWLRLTRHPVRSFAIGTWVASTSILGNVLMVYAPQLENIVHLLLFFNLIVFICFAGIVIYHLQILYRHRAHSQVDGIVLLATVSTQSIVIFMYEALPMVPMMFSVIFVLLGLIFYLLGIYLIYKRYRLNQWNIADAWSNTNCIIHGALSITGLAIVTANLFPDSFLLFLWLTTFVLLVFVEGIEIIRVVKRIKKYGLRHGVLVYHVTQWSRNFTFGMFFAFTYAYLQQPERIISAPLALFQEKFLNVWVWVVLIFLLIQFANFVHFQLSRYISYRRLQLEQVERE